MESQQQHQQVPFVLKSRAVLLLSLCEQHQNRLAAKESDMFPDHQLTEKDMRYYEVLEKKFTDLYRQVERLGVSVEKVCYGLLDRPVMEAFFRGKRNLYERQREQSKRRLQVQQQQQESASPASNTVPPSRRLVGKRLSSAASSSAKKHRKSLSASSSSGDRK